LKLKELACAKYRVVAVMEGDDCPAELFLIDGEDAALAARQGLFTMLEFAAKEGLQSLPAKWVHEANKQEQIFEFIKGPLRLFFFKGVDGQIAVCTTGTRKAGNKADRGEVAKAARFRRDYFAAVENNTLQVVCDETE